MDATFKGIVNCICFGCVLLFHCTVGTFLFQVSAQCTASKIFTNVSIGTPGSRNDNRALALSSIFKQISHSGRTSVFYEDRFHLVGDKAYPNRCWLLAPFKLVI